MANDSTTVQYEIVRNGVTQIGEISNKMDATFNEFDSSMKNALNPEVFKGIAADSFSGDYATLKSQFADFIDLVTRFKNEYARAANILEQHESGLEQKSHDVNNDLQRM